MFFTAFVLCSLRLFKLKREGQTILRQKTSQQSYKTHNTYPGLANRALNNLAQELPF